MTKSINRREFFRNGTTSALSAGVFFSSNLSYPGKSEWDAKIRSYRPFGNLGMKVSDISIGSSRLPDPAIVDYALDLGINYIDTAASYARGNAERTIGQIMKKRRDEAWITTKFDSSSPNSEWNGIKDPSELRKYLTDSLNSSLERLQVDDVDAVLIWNSSPWQIKNPVVYEVFNKLKEEGKVRFLGISGHRSEFPETLKLALDIEEISIIQIAYNFLSDQKVADSIAQAHKKGKAVVAMKTLMGAFDAKIPGSEDLKVSQGRRGQQPQFTLDFKLSAFKWVLSNPNISNLVVTMPSMDEVKNYLAASGEKYGYLDKQKLEYYASATGKKFCRIGCDDCLSSCPNGVPINDILRYRMYFENYRSEKEGMVLYSDVMKGRPGNVCVECSAPCESACLYGLAVKERLLEAHEMLT